MKLSIQISACLLILSLAGCSGYFNNGSGSITDQAAILAIENGGGYLSGPSNDITPFLYRDTNGNNPVLFFSSDRDGTYDIYYAKMNSDGTFQNPVKMTNISTDVSNEYSPVIEWEDDFYNYPDIYLMISYIQEIASNTVIQTHYLSSDLQAGTIDSTYYPALFLTSLDLDDTNMQPDILLSMIDGRTNLDSLYYEIPFNDWGFPNTKYFSAPNIYSLASVHGSGANWTSEVHIFETEYQGKRQLFLNYNFTQTTPGLFYRELNPIEEYASSYNDRWPCVDFGGNGEVYFSSDRGVNGDYDLFRYNIKNFDAVVPPNPFQ